MEISAISKAACPLITGQEQRMLNNRWDFFQQQNRIPKKQKCDPTLPVLVQAKGGAYTSTNAPILTFCQDEIRVSSILGFSF